MTSLWTDDGEVSVADEEDGDIRPIEDADVDDAIKDFARRLVDDIKERKGDAETDSYVGDDGIGRYAFVVFDDPSPSDDD